MLVHAPCSIATFNSTNNRRRLSHVKGIENLWCHVDSWINKEPVLMRNLARIMKNPDWRRVFFRPAPGGGGCSLSWISWVLKISGIVGLHASPEIKEKGLEVMQLPRWFPYGRHFVLTYRRGTTDSPSKVGWISTSFSVEWPITTQIHRSGVNAITQWQWSSFCANMLE